jgi:oligoendopeptidase F
MVEKSYDYKQQRWMLDELFPSGSPQALEKAFNELDEKARSFENLRQSLTPQISVKSFLEAVSDLEGIYRIIYRIQAYASLQFSEDTQNQEYLALMARVEEFGADLGNRILFFSLWWKGLDNEQADRLMAESGDYHYWLDEMRHFKEHTLSEAEEKIINIKNVTGSSALGVLYDSITNRYTFPF